MAIVKMIMSKSSHNLVHYIMDGSAHNTKYTKFRNLLVGGHNIFSDYQNKLNSSYISSQFYAVRKIAGKTKKKTQAFHNIYSFSEEDFPPTNDPKELKNQAQQAYKLISEFMKEQVPDNSQYLIGIQRDGKGGKLHAHVAINSVLTTGKVLNTNDLSLMRKIEVIDKKKVRSKGLFQRLQDYMTDHFQAVTGRKYIPVGRDLSNMVNAKEQQIEDRNAYVWKEDLKDRVVKSAQVSDSLETFKQTLKDIYGVDVTERDVSTQKRDANGKRIKRLGYLYTFTGDDGKQHKSRDFYATKQGSIRGLGKFARPQALMPILQANLEREQQAELADLESISNSDLKKVEVISNGTKRESVSTNTNTTQQKDNNEPEPVFTTGGVKAVKKISVKKSTNSTSYDTSSYDAKTNQLQQQNLQEVARRQQQADADAERERTKREQKRRERERQRKQQLQREQQEASGHQKPANHNQKQEYSNPEPTTNLEQSAKHIERESGFDDPDFG